MVKIKDKQLHINTIQEYAPTSSNFEEEMQLQKKKYNDGLEIAISLTGSLEI